MSEISEQVSAVVVDYHAGEALEACVASLRVNDVRDIVVVENGDSGSVPPSLSETGVVVVSPGVNLGYGRGVNRGAAEVANRPYLLVSNPDVVVHDGAVRALVDYLFAHPDVALVGPRILRPDGSVYPSMRGFPNIGLAGLHAVLEPWWPSNPATKRYRSMKSDGSIDWVSGACFLVRRAAFELVGGFDERYFMFAEDMALCWALHELGFAIGATNDASVTHIEGVSRARATRAMLIAHHVSAFRFEIQTAKGWRRILVPLAGVVLSVRLALVLVTQLRSGS
ncbi:MAG: glycosyltransferase family 2 protein [Acidimicrobiales bacterium]